MQRMQARTSGLTRQRYIMTLISVWGFMHSDLR